jgi:hypothetical protein
LPSSVEKSRCSPRRLRGRIDDALLTAVVPRSFLLIQPSLVLWVWFLCILTSVSGGLYAALGVLLVGHAILLGAYAGFSWEVLAESM